MNSLAHHWRIILNGELMSADEARISPLSDGFLYGLGLFETIKVLGGRPVFFTDHYDRLCRSAAELDLPYIASRDELQTRCLQCSAANQLVDGGLKVVVFQDTGRVSEVIMPRPTHYPAELYVRGFRLKTVQDSRRGKIASLKALNYLTCIQAKRTAQAAGFDEALLIDASGKVLEGATSNLFIVKGEIVLTPMLGQGILPGIARSQVLRLLGKEQIRESIISTALLYEANEVFITNSLLGVTPVAFVDKQSYGLKDNHITRSIMETFRALQLKSRAD